MFRLPILNAIALIVASVILCSQLKPQDKVPPQQEEKRQVINADDLNSRYVVQGPLGVPLEQVITVVGEPFLNSGKGDLHQLRVLVVNGQKLPMPIEMPYSMSSWSDLKRLETGRQYDLRVYQDGAFTGVPTQGIEEARFAQTRSYAFTTSLVVVKIARTDGSAKAK
jgi:hypothetical protein